MHCFSFLYNSGPWSDLIYVLDCLMTAFSSKLSKITQNKCKMSMWGLISPKDSIKNNIQNSSRIYYSACFKTLETMICLLKYIPNEMNSFSNVFNINYNSAKQPE